MSCLVRSPVILLHLHILLYNEVLNIKPAHRATPKNVYTIPGARAAIPNVHSKGGAGKLVLQPGSKRGDRSVSALSFGQERGFWVRDSLDAHGSICGALLRKPTGITQSL